MFPGCGELGDGKASLGVEPPDREASGGVDGTLSTGVGAAARSDSTGVGAAAASACSALRGVDVAASPGCGAPRRGVERLLPSGDNDGWVGDPEDEPLPGSMLRAFAAT